MKLGRLLASLSLVLACLVMAAPPAQAETPHNVLVLYSFGRLLPANVEGDRAVRETFATRPDLPVTISFEFLDNLRFTGEAYERTFVKYLRDKYALMPPDVVVVAADDALSFMLEHRDELFPRIPIVHMFVTSGYLRSIPSLPVDVVGTPIVFEFVATIEQARRWHPSTNRLVIVTGAGPWDRRQEARIRAEAARLPEGLSIEYWAGLPTDDLLRRLRQLQPGAIVFTPGYFLDGNGHEESPRESLEAVASAAPVPVYGMFATQIGTGVVGGRMTSLDDVGRVGAQTAMALLDGAEPATLQVPAVMPAPLQVDWRQIERWGIPAKAVPAGTKIWFREPTIWESHRGLVILGVAVILLQTGLIVALLIMRRSRRFTVAALARNEQHMRLAAQAAGLSTWVLDSDATGQRDEGAIERASTSGVARYLPSDFRETLARIAPEDRPAVDAALRRALETNGEFDVQYRIDGAEGECRWESAKGRADPAQSSRLVGVAIDITQRKRAEVQTELDRAALYHMGRVSLLGQLSASIAHQLSQPLTSILSNAEAAQKMLERDPVDLPELGQIFADIVADDHRAVAVIRRLGALFRRGESQFEPLDLNELVRDSLDIFRATITTRRLTITTDSAADLPLVSGDRVQLQQLLLNLIVNAADAMTDSPEGARDATISTEVRGNSVKLCVADKGPGVPADALDKVFEPFWSTRAGGMGMGLAVCRSIAVAHGGSLTATNAPTGGAVFCASLPALVAP